MIKVTVDNPAAGTYFVLDDVDIGKYQAWADAQTPASEDDLRWGRKHLMLPDSEADPTPSLHYMLPQIRKA